MWYKQEPIKKIGSFTFEKAVTHCRNNDIPNLYLRQSGVEIEPIIKLQPISIICVFFELEQASFSEAFHTFYT